MPYSEKHCIDILRLHNLSISTIDKYLTCYKKFKKSKLSIPEYFIQCKDKRNTLAVLKILYPEQTKDIKFPKVQFRPKILPNTKQLRTFYDTLPDKYKPIFLILMESGIRPGELIDADIDKANKMIILRPHNGNTKYSWISFYRTDFEYLPKFTVNGLGHVFSKTSKKCGIKVNPHMLRSVFAREMSKAGCPSHYIDAFCGRTPQSVLARNYTDYSPETLKEIYNQYL